MNLGDIIKIKGRWGFAIDPDMEVTKIQGSLVTLRSYPNRQGGLLSWMNESVHEIEMLEGRYEIISSSKSK